MSYAVAEDLIGLIPDEWITAATSDAGTRDAIAQVLQAAEDEVDSFLSRRYTLPLDLTATLAGAVPTLRHITRYLAAYIAYGRRGMQEEFPWKDAMKPIRDDLKAIAAGTMPLFPALQPANTDSVIITAPNRAHSHSLSF
jgi:phage gp36-like protein